MQLSKNVMYRNYIVMDMARDIEDQLLDLTKKIISANSGQSWCLKGV